jgi:hypothetical protein
MPRPLKIAAGVFIHAAVTEHAGHTLRAGFLVRDGLIAAARLESDVPLAWACVEAQLVGTPFADWWCRLGVGEGTLTSGHRL